MALAMHTRPGSLASDVQIRPDLILPSFHSPIPHFPAAIVLHGELTTGELNNEGVELLRRVERIRL